MKNTIINLLETNSKIHFAKHNYEKTFIAKTSGKEMYRMPVIYRYKADSWYDKPKEYILPSGERAIDGTIWKWYNEKERRWVNGSPDEG